MKKYEVVKTHEEFTSIIKNGPILKNKFYNIYIRKSDLQLARFGIAVGKKLFSKGYDYIIIMKEKTKEASFVELETKLLELLSKERI